MNLLIKALKRFYRLTYILFTVNWFKLFTYYSTRADVIVWIPSFHLSYWGGDSFLWDVSNIHALIKNKIRFKLFFGFQIGRFQSKKIIYTTSQIFNVYGFSNYVDVLTHVTKQLERQNNLLIPNSHEVKLWENKKTMHLRFKELSINEPRTILYSFKDSKLIPLDFSFPFLIKSEHSCSAKGIFLIRNQVDLDKVINNPEFISVNESIIVQELINMRKDLRVIIVGGEVVSFYWRINTSKDWKPTSTNFGSIVDFENFPDKWKDHILKTFSDLNISTGAFDIAWANDDLSSKPIYLEVSPVYQPNPKLKSTFKHYSYYKKNFSLFNSWDKSYINLIFEIKHKHFNFLKVSNRI